MTSKNLTIQGNGIVVHLDEGGGITQDSLKRLQQLLDAGEIGEPLGAHVHFQRGYSFQLNSLWHGRSIDQKPRIDVVYTLLSGLNTGYAGEGPHGTAKAIEMITGRALTKDQEQIVFRNDHVYFDLRDHEIHVGTSSRPGTEMI